MASQQSIDTNAVRDDDAFLPLEGGCACGAVRYRLDEKPYDTGWCHCCLCQHVSGSGGMVFTTVHKESYRIVKGEASVGRFLSTPFGSRTYCKDCGSPLTIHVDHQPGEIDVAAGTLDDPDAVAPAFHLYAAQAPAWMVMNALLPRYDALRPDTRGLERGQTEAG
ncbi:GFA family protein [Sphingopyxis sp.]|uniref:GFA family protein n=1 Tax=Sphingopyxis sp. TaxID=1908224 RepID=UPI002D77963E|nr:GFA family protein [Sphingopyxis sp.]HET6526882.1 GFA family protein [Sphingopyxis sp.]